MTVGLPGSGVGGVFYLLSALWMPVHQLIRRVRGDRAAAPMRLILPQTSIAAAMIAMLFATGRALGWLLQHTTTAVSAAGAAGPAEAPTQVLPLAMLLLTVGALFALLIGVETAGTILRHRNPVPAPLGAEMSAPAKVEEDAA